MQSNILCGILSVVVLASFTHAQPPPPPNGAKEIQTPEECRCAEPKETDMDKLCHGEFIIKTNIVKKTKISIDYIIQYEILPITIYKEVLDNKAFDPKGTMKLFTDSERCGVDLSDFEGKEYLVSGYYDREKRPVMDKCSSLVYKWDEVPADLEKQLSDLKNLKCPEEEEPMHMGEN